MKSIILILFAILFSVPAFCQQRVGVNTNNPERLLDIYGSGSQFLRLQTTTGFGSKTALELVRGNDAAGIRDWRLENNNGLLRLMTTTDNFVTGGDEVFRLNDSGNLGIGTSNPITRLHLDDGEDATNTLDGYMMLGSKAGQNIVFGNHKIISRNNGAASPLYFQNTGGSTWFNGGNIYMGANGNGRVAIGSTDLNAKLNVTDGGFQIYLRNDIDDVNDWYIGASNSTWQATDDQLLFSPTSSTLDAILHLKNTDDNDGYEAPVMISTPSTQTIYLDGNEIDSATPLYINHNSDEETYINPSGGLVGIGTTNPQGRLHVNTDEVCLSLQRDFATWWITPVQNGNINFFKNTDLLGYISYNGGGEWVAVSDRKLKNSITPMSNVLSRINQLGVYSYSFIHDESGSRDIGVIAQELETIFPEAVSVGNDLYTVSYDQLTSIAIKGIQEQQQLIEDLIARVDQLSNK